MIFELGNGTFVEGIEVDAFKYKQKLLEDKQALLAEIAIIDGKLTVLNG